jgi:predicted DNA-binding mobile mystery protein A
MVTPTEQLDRRFSDLKPWVSLAQRPPHGWLKAIRQSLGMTTGQMAKRINVAQTRVSEMEAAEAHGNITLKTLDRAAEALGCRVIYVVIPNRPLTETLKERAYIVAEKQLAAVEQTMRLEDQEVNDGNHRKETIRQLVEKLLRRPSKIWDDV